MHIVCVGDLMVDVVATVGGPIAPGTDTAASITVQGGGSAANVAAWAAVTGARTTFVGCIGNDAAGRSARADLETAGVTVSVATDPRRPTGTCVVIVSPDGERTMLPDAGANVGLGEIDAPSLLPATADVLYVSGYALFDPGPRRFATAALELARARGWRIAVDAASAAPLRHRGVDRFAADIGTGLVLFANLDEARVFVTGSASAAEGAQELGRRFGQAVVKAGASGMAWSDGTTVIEVAARTADVVDTVGAGDACAAGFLAAWAGDASSMAAGAAPLAAPLAALDAGATWAARAVRVRGGRPSI